MGSRGNFDVAIIGGGFYGCMLALHFKKHFNNVILIEKERDLLTKASYNNQARVHNGYHYPRSYITALRSHLNFSKFTRDFKGAIEGSFLMTYAIASNNSKITSSQFLKLCKQIDLPIQLASDSFKKLFDTRLIEEAFLVQEYVFNAAILRKKIKEKLHKAHIKIYYSTEVEKVKKSKEKIQLVCLSGKIIEAEQVYNCTYSNINTILRNSKISLLPLKHEITEMPLIHMPKSLQKFGVTIMDGPFFSIMPFPDKKLHTIHHVRYTPHLWWKDNVSKKNENIKKLSNSKFIYMIKDIERYMPFLKEAKYVDSLWETKTVLFQNEINDRRPILYKHDYGIKGFHVVMGGKIDNVYDVIEEIENRIA